MFNVSMLTLNDDENEVIASYGADISTYVKEAIPKFIMGVWNFDTDWTAYVAQLRQWESKNVLRHIRRRWIAIMRSGISIDKNLFCCYRRGCRRYTPVPFFY